MKEKHKWGKIEKAYLPIEDESDYHNVQYFQRCGCGEMRIVDKGEAKK